MNNEEIVKEIMHVWDENKSSLNLSLAERNKAELILNHLKCIVTEI